jgi:hypothetical protein
MSPEPKKNKSTSRAEFDLLVEKAREMASKTPQKAAIILTDWLNKPRKLVNSRDESRILIKKKAG